MTLLKQFMVLQNKNIFKQIMKKLVFPFFTILIIFLFHYTNIIWLKYYPAIINFLIFCIFFFSLFYKYTIIQQFVLITEPNASEKVLNYTRKVTCIWALFSFINFIISFITIFMNEKVWAIYNGLVSYILVGFVFMIEYCVRLRVIKREY